MPHKKRTVFERERSSVNGQMLSSGFSLLELLLVIGILAVLAALGFDSYRNYVKNVEFNLSAKGIIFDLRSARSKAMAGENDFPWGVRFWNATDDYYEIFYGTSYNTASTTGTSYLPRSVLFTTPIEGNYTDVIFSKIGGTTTPTVITISFEGQSRNVVATSTGNIY